MTERPDQVTVERHPRDPRDPILVACEREQLWRGRGELAIRAEMERALERRQRLKARDR